MEKRRKSPREKLADLSRAYGSFAEMGRRLNGYLNVKESTAASYVSEMIRGERDVDPRLFKTINRRIKYEELEKPRRQIEKAESISEKLDIALNTRRRQIDLAELLPENVASFGFSFGEDIQDDPRFRFVKQAIEAGVNININAVGRTEEDELVQIRGVIGGIEEVVDKRKKKRTTTRRYISQLYALLREVYNKTGSEAFLTIEARRVAGGE